MNSGSLVYRPEKLSSPCHPGIPFSEKNNSKFWFSSCIYIGHSGLKLRFVSVQKKRFPGAILILEILLYLLFSHFLFSLTLYGRSQHVC